MTSRAPLRIEPHPRGHIASCNGRINNVGVRVEHSYDAPENAVQTAAVFQDWSRKEKERKVQELARFQKNVKSRVLEKEKAKQQQLVADSTKRVQSEQRAAEKAVNLDRIKVCVSCGSKFCVDTYVYIILFFFIHRRSNR